MGLEYTKLAVFQKQLIIIDVEYILWQGPKFKKNHHDVQTFTQ